MNVMVNKRQPPEAPADQDPRWPAVVTRDPAADGKFVYSVQVDRRLLPAVLPVAAGEARRTSAFHATGEEAERAGFRPCKRCKPDQPAARRATCRHGRGDLPPHRGGRGDARASTNSPRRAGMSTYHFHRVFKAVTA